MANYEVTDKKTTLILCVLFGWMGLHHFYNNKRDLGFLYLFTGGMFLIGWIIDIILIANKEESTSTTETISKIMTNKEQLTEDWIDPLYDDIVNFAIENRRISASLIQRKFRIGYNRALYLIEKLEEYGIIGPQHGSNPRQVLVKSISDIDYKKEKKDHTLSDVKNIENIDFLLYQIDYKLNGFEFEQFAKNLLIDNNFEKVIVTKSSNDYGADLTALKDGVKYAIQCKKYSNPVGINAIQEVLGSKSLYNSHVAVVLTNSTFTPNAIKLAETNNVLLWDRNKMREMIEIQKAKKM